MREPRSNNSFGGRQSEPKAEGERGRGQGWRQWCEMRVTERNVRGCRVGTAAGGHRNNG